MAANTDSGHWFLRGVQSAVFYYVSLTPCIEYKYKRKRRNEAKRAEKRAQVITIQPGVVRQPTAFQTNEQWAEELMLGPGPPKPWKKDTLLLKLQKKLPNGEVSSKKVEMTTLSPMPSRLRSQEQFPDLVGSSVSGSRPSSFDTVTQTLSPAEKPPSRPRMERRLSTAMENIKDSFRNSLHPDKWNWIRYDREDENLWGLGEKVTRIWNRATSGTHDSDQITPTGRRRAATNESERYDWGRGKLPALNDLHPSVVSQLPATREEAAWMLLPPPSAAVMAGRTRPTAEIANRRPLCVIGRPQLEQQEQEVDDRVYEESQDELTDAEAAEHQRHQSDPAPKIATAAALVEGRPKPKVRPGSWHFNYIVPTAPA